jgi:hypothetical protein
LRFILRVLDHNEKSIHFLKKLNSIVKLIIILLDVVIGATSPDGCIDFIKKAKANDYFPKALILSNCVTDKYTEELGEDGR